jgi:hypothetical protein
MDIQFFAMLRPFDKLRAQQEEVHGLHPDLEQPSHSMAVKGGRTYV